MISNMSDDVLSISTASASQPALRAYYPVPGNHESSGTLIETNAQNEAVRGLAPPGGGVLLPVGGQVIATQDVPIRLAVQVNRQASAASYAAQLVTGYVVDNLTKQIPPASAQSYEMGIAGCVRRAPALWRGLSERLPAAAAAALQATLTTVPACQDLQRKVTSDHAEALWAAAATGRLTANALREDLATVAHAAGVTGWESHLGGLPRRPVVIAEGAH